MRHRRNTPTSAPTHRLRVSAVTPCVAAMLVALLTGAAPVPDAPAEERRGSAAVHEDRGILAKSPDDHGTSHRGPSPAASPRPDGNARNDGPPRNAGGPGDGGTGEDPGVFGTHDLYESGPEGEEGSAPSHRPATTAATGKVSPVLPLGAGMTLIGLGLALIALRLRHG